MHARGPRQPVVQVAHFRLVNAEDQEGLSGRPAGGGRRFGRLIVPKVVHERGRMRYTGTAAAPASLGRRSS